MLSDNVLLHLARAIPVGATFSFNMCTLGVACNKQCVQWIESKKLFLKTLLILQFNKILETHLGGCLYSNGGLPSLA